MNKEKTRFCFEQEILDCWKVTDDLKMLLEGILDKNISRDEIANIVLGLEQLYNLKFQRTFETFEYLISKKEI